MNSLIEKYPKEVEAILAKYPPAEKRAAVMPLLYLAQREPGFITKQALSEVGELAGISATDVASIVGFYSLYHEEPGGKYRIQVCNDLPCALRGAEEFLEKLCQNLGIKVGETTSDGVVTIEAVTCLAGCDRAPMFQVQSGDGLEYHENQTVESAMALVDSWRKAGEINLTLPQASAEPAPQPEKSAETLNKPVVDQAEGGITTLSRPERIKIQQKGGQ